MLINPILKTLTCDDLRQRYSNTIVQYDEKPIYIHSFEQYIDHVSINFQPFIESNFSWANSIQCEVFDSDKLNTERPPSRWYPSTYKGVHVYFACKTARQFQRGLTTRNSHIWSSGTSPRWEWFVTEIFNRENYELGWRNEFQYQKLFALAEKGKQTLLSPFLFSFGRELLYKTKKVGHMYKGYIHLYEPIFEQEIKECISKVDCEYHLLEV